jgi:hypothetical protein
MARDFSEAGRRAKRFGAASGPASVQRRKRRGAAASPGGAVATRIRFAGGPSIMITSAAAPLADRDPSTGTSRSGALASTSASAARGMVMQSGSSDAGTTRTGPGGGSGRMGGAASASGAGCPGCSGSISGAAAPLSAGGAGDPERGPGPAQPVVMPAASAARTSASIRLIQPPPRPPSNLTSLVEARSYSPAAAGQQRSNPSRRPAKPTSRRRSGRGVVSSPSRGACS